MRFFLKSLAISVGAFVVGVPAAGAHTVGSVSSTQGTVLVMRGNSVVQVNAGDDIRQGDRVLSRSGASATFSNGATLNADMSVLAKSGLSESSFTSKAGGASQPKRSDESNSSGLFGKSSGGKYEASYDKDRENDRGKDDRVRDNDRDHNHNDKDPWKGKPNRPDPCSD